MGKGVQEQKARVEMIKEKEQYLELSQLGHFSEGGKVCSGKGRVYEGSGKDMGWGQKEGELYGDKE